MLPRSIIGGLDIFCEGDGGERIMCVCDEAR
jgi:hypothetical protein